MTAITDPATRLLMLAALVRDPAGLSPEQACELRGLTAEELVRIAGMSDPRLEASMVGGIGLALKRTEAISAREREVDYLVVNGATYRLVHRLLRMPMNHLMAAKKRLNVKGGRRPRMPTPAEREAILAWWWKRTEGKESVAAYIELHKAFPGWNFATLDAVVHEMDEEPEQPKRRPKLALVA